MGKINRVTSIVTELFFSFFLIPYLYLKLRNCLLIFVFLPTIDWFNPLLQRPQHFALNLSRYITVVYGTTNYSHDRVWGVKHISQRVLITNIWNELLRIRPNCLIFLLSTQQLTTVKEIYKIINKGGKLVYDYVDEIHYDVSGSEEMTDFLTLRHKYIKESGCASLVLCVSKKLYDEMLEYYPKEKVLLVPNGVDYGHFQVKKDAKTIPVDMKKIVSMKKPIIGYYGAMANWLDYELINQTAKSHPEWNFVFIGLDFYGGLNKLDQSFDNIHFLGSKDYLKLPKYGIWFDVAIIPFSKGEIAKSTSPIKMYEYMAMGKPIIVTEDLLECHGFKGVYISKNEIVDFENNIKKALRARFDKNILNALYQSAKDNTWGKRAKIIYEKLSLVS